MVFAQLIIFLLCIFEKLNARPIKVVECSFVFQICVDARKTPTPLATDFIPFSRISIWQAIQSVDASVNDWMKNHRGDTRTVLHDAPKFYAQLGFGLGALIHMIKGE